MNLSKVVVVANSTIGNALYIFGGIFTFFPLFGFIVFAIQGNININDVILLLVILAASVSSIVKGTQIKRRVDRFKQYVSLISREKINSIDQIAVATNQSADFVRKDLQKMIDKRFFANAFIDTATNNIIIVGGQTAPETSTNTEYTAPPSASVQNLARTAPVLSQNVVQATMEAVDCSGCGASATKLKGTQSSCEYCGSLI